MFEVAQAKGLLERMNLDGSENTASHSKKKLVTRLNFSSWIIPTTDVEAFILSGEVSPSFMELLR